MRLGPLLLCAFASTTRMSFQKERSLMVNNQLRARGLKDERVLRAMGTVPREHFVASDLAPQAYNDHPLPIGNNQTISQPYMVALMAEVAKIQPTDKILEIGTGCGYSAAVLSTLGETVYTAEIIPELGKDAKERLAALGYENVMVLVEDGSTGFTEYAPFDVIIVTAGAPSIPTELLFQLSKGGRMIVPVRANNGILLQPIEQLLRITRTAEENVPENFRVEQLEEVRFVPLRGRAGWGEA